MAFYTVVIHDALLPSVYDLLPLSIRGILLTSHEHLDHHLLNRRNYGQMFNIWDKLAKTYTPATCESRSFFEAPNSVKNLKPQTL